MRISRFLLPFTLGAVSVLLVMVSAERIVPGALGRVGSALHPADTMPAAPLADGAAAPADSAGEVPFVVGTPVPAPTVPLPSPAVPVVAEPGATGLLIPVQGVLASSLVNTYDQARGQGRRHDAIDIMAPRGTPVVAVADGVVMKLFQSERGGITLYELAPDRRTIYYYAHLDRYAPGIADGQALRRGQVLGYVGNTGDAGPGNYHLHFEVSTTADPKKYWGGTPQNPYPLLR
jgi:murein DD-endopeptidase MepM/ murein hydrolase activator NlpD